MPHPDVVEETADTGPPPSGSGGHFRKIMGDPDPGYTAECIGDSLFDNNFSDELSKAEWGLAKDVETKLCKAKDCAEVRD